MTLVNHRVAPPCNVTVVQTYQKCYCL